MTSYKSMLLVLGTCSALLLTAGTSGASYRSAAGHAPVMRQNAARHGWISPMAKKMKLTFVSDYTSSLILIYAQGNESAGPIGEIVNGISNPQGIALDTSGTLYVTNQGNNTVTEYPFGSTDPSVTLSTDISRPLDVSVDKHGNVYVGEPSASMVLEFAPGSTYPNAIVSITHPSGLTNVKNGDLYLTYNNSFSQYGGAVARCKPLKTKCKDLGIVVGFAQGMAIDSQGNLIVGDAYAEVIDIFAPGQTTPFRTITTHYEEPGKFALNSDDSVLYMADPANFAIRLLDYASGNEISHFTFGSADELEGVALYPGQKPGK